MDFLKKLKSPVALKSEPAQPQAQPEPEPRKPAPEQTPPVQASSRPQPQAAPRPQAAPQAQQRPDQPSLQQAARPRVQTQPPPGPVTHAAPPAAEHQPQAPVWALTDAGTQRQPQARRPDSPQPLQTAPRVATAQPRAQTAAKTPPGTHSAAQTVGPVPAGAGITEVRNALGATVPGVHLSSAPGFWRTVWAMHPNRTKRRLRRLLLSWEKLGAYLSSSGAGEELTPAAETAFLRAKIDIARSVGYLKLLDGTGGIAKEASQRETQFIELLERFPSLHSARMAGEAAKKNLYYNWHLLYLFLHKLLGAGLYETREGTGAAAFARRVETVIAPGKAVSTGGRGAR